MENLQYLFVAFSFVWIILFIYIYILQRRTAALNKEVLALKELIKSEE